MGEARAISDLYSRTRWSDVLNGSQNYRTISRSVRQAHRALVLHGATHRQASARIPAFRYEFLTSGTDSWRKQQARLHRSRLENPRLTCCVTVFARVVSFVGCIVALFFLTRDFVASKKSRLHSSHFQYEGKIQLPPISFCHAALGMPGFPTFGEGDGERGMPLFSARAFYRQCSGESLKDVSHALTPSFAATQPSKCVRRLSHLDVKNVLGSSSFSKSSFDQDCRLCFQFGGSAPLLLHDPSQGAALPPQAASQFLVHLETSKVLSECRMYIKVGTT